MLKIFWPFGLVSLAYQIEGFGTIPRMGNLLFARLIMWWNQYPLPGTHRKEENRVLETWMDLTGNSFGIYMFPTRFEISFGDALIMHWLWRLIFIGDNLGMIPIVPTVAMIRRPLNILYFAANAQRKFGSYAQLLLISLVLGKEWRLVNGGYLCLEETHPTVEPWQHLFDGLYGKTGINGSLKANNGNRW